MGGVGVQESMQIRKSALNNLSQRCQVDTLERVTSVERIVNLLPNNTTHPISM